MTPTARYRGPANLLVCIAILAIGSLLIGLLISSLFHRSLGESFRLACVFLTGLSMILSLVLVGLGLTCRRPCPSGLRPPPYEDALACRRRRVAGIGIVGVDFIRPHIHLMRNLLYDPGFRAVAGSGKRDLAVLGIGPVGED